MPDLQGSDGWILMNQDQQMVYAREIDPWSDAAELEIDESLDQLQSEHERTRSAVEGLREAFSRLDLSTGANASAMATPVQEEPQPQHWSPAQDDVVRITRDYAGLRQGQLAVIESFYTPPLRRPTAPRNDGCGVASCTSCNPPAESSVSLFTLRLADISQPVSYEGQYLTVPLSVVEPVDHDQTGHVRCSFAGHGDYYSRAHSLRDSCVSPVAVSAELDVVGLLVPSFRTAFAEQIEERDAARQVIVQRADQLVRDAFYRVSGAGYYNSHIAQFDHRGNGDVVVCNIMDTSGEVVRYGARLSIFQIGDRILHWDRSNMPPSFIQFDDTRYHGGPVTVNDLEVVDSLDAHDCDERCFDSGCTARVPGEISYATPARIQRIPFRLRLQAQHIHLGINDDEDDRDDNGEEDDSDYYDDEPPDEFAGDIPINSYSYRPRLIFSGDGPVFLGTELELSTGDGRAGELAQARAAKVMTQNPIGDLIYLKSDGSIHGYGFEAVTHPMSYDWILQNWPDDLLLQARNAGAVPHSSCGMHVHVSRSGFSGPVHAYKWIKFMYRNAQPLTRMARRDPGQWGSFDQTAERAAAKWYAKGGYGSRHRYCAVNCTPKDTFEVRIFGPTLNRTRFLGSLGLVDASVEYTRQLSTQDILKRGGWAFENFRDYATSFKKYAPLQKEIVRLIDRA